MKRVATVFLNLQKVFGAIQSIFRLIEEILLCVYLQYEGCMYTIHVFLTFECKSLSNATIGNLTLKHTNSNFCGMSFGN